MTPEPKPPARDLSDPFIIFSDPRDGDRFKFRGREYVIRKHNGFYANEVVGIELEYPTHCNLSWYAGRRHLITDIRPVPNPPEAIGPVDSTPSSTTPSPAIQTPNGLKSALNIIPEKDAPGKSDQTITESAADRIARLNAFVAHLQRASELVRTWPEWQQAVLGNSPTPAKDQPCSYGNTKPSAQTPNGGGTAKVDLESKEINANPADDAWAMEEAKQLTECQPEWQVSTRATAAALVKAEQRGEQSAKVKIMATPMLEPLIQVVKERDAALAKVNELSLDKDQLAATLKENEELEAQCERLAAENAAMRLLAENVTAAWESYERFGPDCRLEGDGMIHASILEELFEKTSAVTNAPSPIVADYIKCREAIEVLRSQPGEWHWNGVHLMQIAEGAISDVGTKDPADAIRAGRGKA